MSTQPKIRWTRRGQGVYYAEDPDSHYFQAFVFSAPTCWLWAWAVYGRAISRAGVEFTFQRAKGKAAKAVEEIRASREQA